MMSVVGSKELKKAETVVKRGYDNSLEMEFEAISYNEGFARMAVSAFVAPLNPTLEEMADVKTAVSEAVTNAVIHGYENVAGYIPGRMECPREISNGKIRMKCCISGDILHIEIEDSGKGIEDIEQAMEPLYTTKPELERSGMGFAFMEAFMDDLKVFSVPNVGTKVVMEKKLGSSPWLSDEE